MDGGPIVPETAKSKLILLEGDPMYRIDDFAKVEAMTSKFIRSLPASSVTAARH